VKERIPRVMCSPVVGERRVMFNDAGGAVFEFELDGGEVRGKGMFFIFMEKWIALLATCEKSTNTRLSFAVVLAVVELLVVSAERVVFASTPEAMPVLMEEFVPDTGSTGERSYGVLTRVHPRPGTSRRAFVRGSVIHPRQFSAGPVGDRCA